MFCEAGGFKPHLPTPKKTMGIPTPGLDHMSEAELFFLYKPDFVVSNLYSDRLYLNILLISSEMEQPVPSMERVALWRNIGYQRQPIRYLETRPGAL